MSCFAFQWHLSDRCNLRCAHCYQADHTAAREQGAGFWLKLLEHICRGLGSDESLAINLTGGEPLLLDDLPVLAEALEQNPRVSEWQLISNGTIAFGPAFEALKACRKLQVVKISVEAGRPEANDAVRGSGSFRRVEENLERFRGLGRPLVAMVTLGAHNLPTLDSCWPWVVEQGLDGLLLERFVPLGSGLHLAPGPVDETTWRRALRRLALQVGMDTAEEDLDWVRALWIRRGSEGDVELVAAACELGESMALMPDGEVFACRRLPRGLGRMPEQSFGDIRAKLVTLWPLTAGCRALSEALLR